ncbi:TetR/AcrR family transcriptional regulator [Truepera radiovictrix]|uniref:Transcriptional regulator, TetR family n=1 Tax=Truepera radiovictrix (strain DSM 17093 / CIP 108686 / LMG 22925 / RQ-24) TaxID=649638 RepID=D7CR19_TRURR|nr:TetR/AcrR family transcriptional regulator [Truepera radiovictrix]ADI13419.1 transcriptional regulator, TetR family [Truepera radiovictrix DSM 17093]WMT58019.1 TetR/AcrR family transcriptional regulator [Truepera radiovictrix]
MPYPAKTTSERVLAAALELLERGGEGALSMRALAASLGLSASSLYRHFPNREALLNALGDESTRLLHAALARASAGRDPRGALVGVAHGYLEFARAHPALYDLVMAPRATPGPGKDVWTFLLGVLGGVTGRSDDTAAAVALWSFLHGFVTLERAGLFGPSGPQGGLERGLAALLAGLERT